MKSKTSKMMSITILQMYITLKKNYKEKYIYIHIYTKRK